MINDIEKKYIYIIFGVAIIILFIVLAIIWIPMFKSDTNDMISQFQNLPRNTYVDNKKKEYQNAILNYINIEYIDKTIDIINQDYLKKYNLDENSVKQYLKDNQLVGYISNSTIVSFSKIVTDNKKNIYSYVYRIGNVEKKIHIIEEYYNKYTISFEQDGYPIIDEQVSTAEFNDVVFDIKEKSSYDEEIILEFVAQNNGNNEYYINLENIADSSVTITEGSIYNISSVILGSEYSKIVLGPGSRVSFEVNYAVPIELQSLIKNVIFNNVYDYSGNHTQISLNIN